MQHVLLECLPVVVQVKEDLHHARVRVLERSVGLVKAGTELVHLGHLARQRDVEMVVVKADASDRRLRMQHVGPRERAEPIEHPGGLPTGIVKSAVNLRSHLGPRGLVLTRRGHCHAHAK